MKSRLLIVLYLVIVTLLLLYGLSSASTLQR